MATKMTGWKGLKFPFQFANGKPAVSQATVESNDYSHITESIIQIIGTVSGERKFSKHIGIKTRLTFKSFSPELIPYYESVIKEALSVGETRISVDYIKTDTSELKDGFVKFTIGWVLLKYNIPHITEAYVIAGGGGT